MIGDPDSKDFDIQLMTYLLRTITIIHTENSTNVKDINTISNLRNILDHSSNLIISNNEFEDKWNEVSNVCIIVFHFFVSYIEKVRLFSVLRLYIYIYIYDF